MRQWQLITIWAAWMLLLLMLCSCAATRCVEVPMVREVVAHQRDTLTIRDSVFVHDSVMVSRRGDTVLVEKYSIVYRDRWRDHLSTDSFVRRDTVTVVCHAEKPAAPWRRARDALSSALLWMLAAAALLLLARVVYNKYVKVGK